MFGDISRWSLNSGDFPAGRIERNVASRFHALYPASTTLRLPRPLAPRDAPSGEKCRDFQAFQIPLDTGAMPPKSRGLGQSSRKYARSHPRILLTTLICRVGLRMGSRANARRNRQSVGHQPSNPVRFQQLRGLLGQVPRKVPEAGTIPASGHRFQSEQVHDPLGQVLLA